VSIELFILERVSSYDFRATKGRTNDMANHMNHLIKHLHTPVQHAQKSGNPRKASGSLKERAAALGSPLLSVLANLHYLMGTLMRVMLVVGGTSRMSGIQDFPWLRRGLLALALLTAGFTVYQMLSRKHTRRMLLLDSGSVLFTAGMIIWSIATFGF
jgi:hypothetical protein